MAYSSKPISSSGAVVRSLNTNFQPSTQNDVVGIYSIGISTTVNLVTPSQSGTVILEISPDGSTGWVTLSSTQNSTSGTLVIGLTLTNAQICAIGGVIPKGYFARLTSSGAATITFQNGWEMQI